MPALALQLGPDKKDTESPFEDSVLDTIRSWGFTVRPQVGAAGYRIDLGVRHPAHAGEVYAIGVECDGAMYLSSQSARDRDRLREQVLRALGWNLHRIWGTAWYRHRTEEENKLRAAIEAAVAAPIGGRLSMPAVDRPVITTVGVVLGDGPDWAKPYLKADLETLPTWASPSDYDSRFFVIPAIEKLAAVEGPVHITVALQRMREAWSIGRVGAQIRATIEASIQDAHVHWDGAFITAMAHPTSTVRYPAAGVIRIVEQISDPELQLALKNLVAEGGTVGTEELLTATARLFGWARRGADINARLTMMIHDMITDGRLTQRPEGLTTEDVRR
jgi:very-short-patch-repair endonuclease